MPAALDESSGAVIFHEIQSDFEGSDYRFNQQVKVA